MIVFGGGVYHCHFKFKLLYYMCLYKHSARIDGCARSRPLGTASPEIQHRKRLRSCNYCTGFTAYSVAKEHHDQHRKTRIIAANRYHINSRLATGKWKNYEKVGCGASANHAAMSRSEAPNRAVIFLQWSQKLAALSHCLKREAG